MPDSLSTITISAISAAEAQLLADLKTAGVTDITAVTGFATQWAPAVATWSLAMAQAQLAGDTAGVQRFKDDLADLAARGAAQAATAGILLEGQAEGAAQTFIQAVFAAAAKAAVSAIVLA